MARDGYLMERVLPGDRRICLLPMLFCKVRLTVGPATGYLYDRGY